MKKWIHAIYSDNRGFLKFGRHIGRGLKKTILRGIFQYFLKIGALFHLPRTNVLWHGFTKWIPCDIPMLLLDHLLDVEFNSTSNEYPHCILLMGPTQQKMRNIWNLAVCDLTTDCFEICIISSDSFLLSRSLFLLCFLLFLLIRTHPDVCDFKGNITGSSLSETMP